MSRPRLLLADDHRIVSEGLKSLLANDFVLVGMVEDGRALVTAAKSLRPEVIVVDISMPNLNGIEAITLIRKQDAAVKIVVLTMHQDPAYARRALEAGANGYVIKHSAAVELVLAINSALKGHTFISSALTGDVLRNAGRSAESGLKPAAMLTSRQREILQLLAEGRSAKQIAASLAISSRTVEFHKYQIMESRGIHSTAELVHFAIKHGIVSI